MTVRTKRAVSFTSEKCLNFVYVCVCVCVCVCVRACVRVCVCERERERDDFDACWRVVSVFDVWVDFNVCGRVVNSLNACGRVASDFLRILMHVGVS